MTTAIKEARSGLNPENIQEVLNASVSAKHATMGNQQQYQLPREYAEFFASLLPTRSPEVIVDPQCAAGNLLNASSYWPHKCGFEIDNRFKNVSDSIDRVIGNCVKAWAALDDLYPEIRFDCQVANPPFGLLWLAGDKKVDSTEYTWRKIMERASDRGHGYFVANWKTIERLGIDKHPRVYLYQRFPAGIWKNCDVEIGVVHWAAFDVPHFGALVYQSTLNFEEHRGTIHKVRSHFRGFRVEPLLFGKADIKCAWVQIQTVLDEERVKQPPYNVWVEKDGKLRAYLSTRAQVKRKLTRADVLRLSTIDDCHAITLTTERETRSLLTELVNSGFYTIQPAAEKAIRDALDEVKMLAVPIMPCTPFELCAWADELDRLECAESGGLAFTPGRSYEITTATYSWTGGFARDKVHFSETTGTTYTAKHQCELSGTDKYIQVSDDDGQVHKFMDRPNQAFSWEHDESLLWKIFKAPVVNTIAETHADKIAHNLQTLEACEMLADYKYYPGQLGYIARVACKDYGLIAAGTGVGKSLILLSLIQLKAPHRALIIAPQSTIRGGSDDEDEGGGEYTSAQWIAEIRRFAPGLPVFELFSMEDYHRIRKANNGILPHGLYVSYYEAVTLNNARERCPDTWNDTKLLKECQRITGDVTMELPEVPDDAENFEKHWAKTVGVERNGIRCIVQPSMGTLIGHEFDFVGIDEMHRISNLDASTTQVLIRLQPKFRYGFSGTPISNVVTNIFSLMGWLCVPEFHKGERRNAAWPYSREEIARFEATFLSQERDYTQEDMNKKRDKNWRGKCVKVSPVISSPARLLKMLKPTMAYISKAACNPQYKEAEIIEVRVPMGAEQSKLYAHFLNRHNIQAKHRLERARKQTAYLRNICADPEGFEHGGPVVLSNFNPKTCAILELTAELLAKGEQVVIITARVGQTNTLQIKLNEAGVKTSRIDSTIGAANQSNEANLFKRSRTQVMLMGIRCAAAHSFSQCWNEIIGSIEYSPGPLNQAKGRIDRVNSPRQAKIWCILHRHSIEEYQHDLCGTKDDAATICLRGQRIPRTFRPVDASDILAAAIDGFREAGVNERDCEAQWPKLREKFKIK